MQDFESIRPINDDEVRETLARLVNDPQLARTLIRFRFGRWPAWTYPIIGLLIRSRLKKHVLPINNIADFQNRVAPYMKRMIQTTTDKLVVTGLDGHDVESPCLFISNHRDIALDPAFVNWSLHREGNETVRIAIGDNLVSQQWVSDLMRLNKSFIVNRSATSKREKLAASKQLSAYIHHSLRQDQAHIWIAQKEGRAKDGNDQTNPALLSMIALNKPKTQSFEEYLDELHIVPVSISYEYDPCDLIKARELEALEARGEYEKEDHEDMQSISKGITGNKGRVYVHFGEALKGAESSRELAAMLDKSIQLSYHLFPSNLAAAQEMGQDISSLKHDYTEGDLKKALKKLSKRVGDEPDSVRKKLLSMYAAPVINRLKHTD